MKQHYDRSATQTQFQVGNKVFVYIPRTTKGLSRKLTSHWAGPYYIVKQTGPVTFKVKSVSNNTPLSVPVHANRMKICHDRKIRPTEEPDVRDDGFEISEDEIPQDNFLPVPKNRPALPAPHTPTTTTTDNTQNGRIVLGQNDVYAVEKYQRRGYVVGKTVPGKLGGVGCQAQHLGTQR